MVQNTEDFLAHYGVKGMRWGVRKERAPVEKASANAKGTSGQSEDSARAAAARTKARTKGYDSLSNAEMRQLIERMNLEQQMSRLQPAKVSRGRQFANGAGTALKTVNAIISFIRSPVGRLLVNTMDSMIKVDGQDARVIGDTLDKFLGSGKKKK